MRLRLVRAEGRVVAAEQSVGDCQVAERGVLDILELEVAL
jgi:hypothetical protein